MTVKLVINNDKTQLVVMAPRKASNLRDQVSVKAGEHVIVPTQTAKLLGGVVSQDENGNSTYLAANSPS